MEFKEKYLKYKNKYLELKKQLGGLITRPGLTLANIPRIGLFYNLTGIATNYTPIPIPTTYTDLLETVFMYGFDVSGTRTPISDNFIINSLNEIDKIYIYDFANMGGKMDDYRDKQHTAYKRVQDNEETDMPLKRIGIKLDKIDAEIEAKEKSGIPNKQEEEKQIEGNIEKKMKKYEDRLSRKFGVMPDPSLDTSGNVTDKEGELDETQSIKIDDYGIIRDLSGVIMGHNSAIPYEFNPPTHFVPSAPQDHYVDFMKNIILHAQENSKIGKNNLYIICGKSHHTDPNQVENNLLVAFTKLGFTRTDFPNILTLTSTLTDSTQAMIFDNRADDDLLFWICGMLFSQFLTKNNEHIKTIDPLRGTILNTNININNVQPIKTEHNIISTINGTPYTFPNKVTEVTYLNNGPSLFLITNDTQKMCDVKRNQDGTITNKNLWSEFLNKDYNGNVIGNLSITGVSLNGFPNIYIQRCCENVLTFIMRSGNSAEPKNYYVLDKKTKLLDVMGFDVINKCSNNQLYRRDASFNYHINNSIDNINDLVTEINRFINCNNYEKFMTLIMFLKQTYYATPWKDNNQPSHSMTNDTINNLVHLKLA